MMLIPRSVRIYVAVAPTNLRQSFEGLSNAVRSVLKGDPISGHMFLFLNRRRSQVKILLWTRGGFTILHKRLERGTFAFAAKVDPGVASVEIAAHELSMLLEGLEVTSVRMKKRWEPTRARRRGQDSQSQPRLRLLHELTTRKGAGTCPPRPRKIRNRRTPKL